MATFLSNTDLSTLEKEGLDTNIFLSLIVNNAGTYTAAVTKKIHHKITSCDEQTYNYFGEKECPIAVENNINEYDTVDYYMLDIEKPVNSENYGDIVQRISDITKNKQAAKEQKPSSRANYAGTLIENKLSTHLPLFPSTGYDRDKYKNEVHKEMKEEKNNTYYNKYGEYIDYNIVKFDEAQVSSIVRQLIMGSVVLKPKNNINDWIDKMPTIYGNRFSNLNEYKIFVDCFAEFLINEAFDKNVLEEGYDEDDMMAICAYKVVEKLESLHQNSYIDVIKKVLEKYIL